MIDLSIPIIGADEQLIRQLCGITWTPPTPIADSHFDSVRPTNNRRQHARYAAHVPAVCYPVLTSLEVDVLRCVDGVLIDISDQGLSLQLVETSIAVGSYWVVGVDAGGLGWRYSDFQVLNVEQRGKRSTSIRGRWGGPLESIFRDEMYLPTFDPIRFRYSLPSPERVMTSFSAIGAVERRVLDQILVCPECEALPTLRRGCCQCLSHDTQPSRMIHHFACAHVDFVDRFDQGNEIICPKCLGRKMIIGADYEYLEGPVICGECGHNDLEEIAIGHCMSCAYRFPLELAKEVEVVGYHVHRLDSLAIINSQLRSDLDVPSVSGF